MWCMVLFGFDGEGGGIVVLDGVGQLEEGVYSVRLKALAM